VTAAQAPQITTSLSAAVLVKHARMVQIFQAFA